MGAGWVAGNVRARALARRRLGPATVSGMARHRDLDGALLPLANTPYGREVRPGQSLAEAEHAIAAVLLWHLRVLAGWQPRPGVDQLRALAGWFELANIDALARKLTGAADPGQRAEALFRLGSLATAWPTLSGSTTVTELRAALARSVWGDPGGISPRSLALGPRLAWAERLTARVPPLAGCAAGAVALLVAREHGYAGRPLDGVARLRAGRLIGIEALDTADLAELTRRLPGRARWALADVAAPEDLWRAEHRWWSRLEREGIALLRRPGPRPGAAVGAAVVLAVDAWRVRGATESAARGGARAEVPDAMG